MKQEKIDYLRKYFELPNEIPDSEIVEKLKDSTNSALYDLHGAFADLGEAIKVELNKTAKKINALFGIK